VLEAGLPEDADRGEAERLVQADAGRVGQGDTGVGGDQALSRQQVEQRQVEAAPDPGAAGMPGDVDGDLDRPLVGAAVAVPRGVGVAEQLAVALAHEPGKPGQDLPDAPAHLGHAGRLGLERDGRVAHDRRVDGLHLRRVVLPCQPGHRGGRHAADCAARRHPPRAAAGGGILDRRAAAHRARS
jgi:hypothetical protein